MSSCARWTDGITASCYSVAEPVSVDLWQFLYVRVSLVYTVLCIDEVAILSIFVFSILLVGSCFISLLAEKLSHS